MFRWWKQYWRKHTIPIPKTYALLLKRRLTAIYFFCTFNVFGFTLIAILQQAYPMTEAEKKQPGTYYARLYQEADTTIVKVDGFKIVDQYTMSGAVDLIPKEFQKDTSTPPTDVPQVKPIDQELLTD